MNNSCDILRILGEKEGEKGGEGSPSHKHSGSEHDDPPGIKCDDEQTPKKIEVLMGTSSNQMGSCPLLVCCFSCLTHLIRLYPLKTVPLDTLRRDTVIKI